MQWHEKLSFIILTYFCASWLCIYWDNIQFALEVETYSAAGHAIGEYQVNYLERCEKNGKIRR